MNHAAGGIGKLMNPRTDKPRAICSCGKRCYGSRKAARAAHRTAKFRLHIYLCPDSGHWHASNAEKKL